MKKTIAMVFLLLAGMQSLFAQNNKENAADTGKTVTVSEPVTANDLLTLILDPYINLKNALVSDNNEAARKSAKELFDAMNKVKAEELKGKEYAAWENYGKKISYDAEHIKASDDVEHQREHFITLSQNIYEVAKALNTNSINLFYQFCPMANNGKGAYWVSEQENISNPYFGKKMMTCGSTKEVIKPASRK